MAVAFLAALAFLLPLWGWSPHILDDARFDSFGMATAVSLLFGVCFFKRTSLRVPKGIYWITAGYACGLIALFFAANDPAPLSSTAFSKSSAQGLLDRAPLAGALALVALVGVIRTEKQLRVLLGAILAGTAAAVWYGLAQSIGLGPEVFGPQDYAPPVLPFPGTNHAATVLAPLIVGTLAWLFQKQRATKETRWLWFAFLLPAVFLLGQFGVSAARISLPLGLAWLIWRQGKARRKGILMASCALLALMTLGEGAREWRMSDSAHPDGIRPAWSTLLGRIDMAEASLLRSFDEPLGIGLGRFEVDYPSWRGDFEAWTSSGFWSSPTFGHPKTPHNEVVLALVENGFLGAILLAIGVILLLRNKQRPSWATGALLTMGVHALSHAPLSDHSSALILLAILLGLREPGRAAEASLAPTSTKLLPFRPFTISTVAVGALCFTALVPAWSQSYGEWLLSRRFAAIQIDPDGSAKLDPQISVDLLAHAAEIRPGNALTWALMATDFRETGQHETAAQLWQETLLRSPYSMAARLGSFRAHLSLEQESTALLHLESAELLEPRFRLVRDYRTQWLHGRASDWLTRNPPLFQEGLLFRAMAYARENEFDETRNTLKALGPFAEGHRAVVERVRLDANLDEGLMRTLVLRIHPDWEPLLGPAWVGYRGFEPAAAR
ncbi:MAG: hypothetical protein HN405_06920 [Planctomycetes bacterium]|jgi:hypothetical protein|nr:hypothetical protein [Planctomycetota bacterium]MBT4028140.1 hypothetical protein [Planctomycetota bacterium]MBT4560735.1 hypothetical protein [Planctomycetota bacterium]MBT5100436.1 hypothetical protein [Planctomycetota bacterium]MBT7319193.1 hypothetical protein [Planctomycetota bacterium]